MRKFVAIATLVVVAGLSYSHVASAAGNLSYLDCGAGTVHIATSTFSDVTFWAYIPTGVSLPDMLNYASSTSAITFINEYHSSGDHALGGGSGFCSGGYSVLFLYSDNSPTLSTNYSYYEYDFNGSQSSGIQNTHFISVLPLNHSVLATTSTSTLLGFTAYISSSDVGMRIDYTFDSLNTVTNFLCPSYASILCPNGNGSKTYSVYATTSGVMVWSTTTDSVLGVGSYSGTIVMRDYCLVGVCFSIKHDVTGALLSTTTNFAVVQGSLLGQSWQNATDELNTFISSQAPTTTLSSACSFSNFNGTACMTGLLIPTSEQVSDILDRGRNIFVLGYVSDFGYILTSSTTKPLVLIDSVLPDALPIAGGAHLYLSLDHAFDWLLNATSGPYMSSTASSTGTFYDITSYYWNILVYAGAGFYVIGRIIGSKLIPKIKL